jgi:hypothetical protein
MLNNNWNETQKLLDSVYKQTGSTSLVLERLYDVHINNGFICNKKIASISDITEIKDEEYGISYYIQCNPERINRGVSSNPNKNAKYIIPRKGGMPCFLCIENIKIQWPNERGYEIKIGEESYVFLPNIVPLFKHHFTIASVKHLPQKFSMQVLIGISELLPDHWVIQNGNGAGSSNPWHYHLQSLKDYLPITDAKTEKNENLLLGDGRIIEAEILYYPINVYKFVINKDDKESMANIEFLVKKFLATSKQHSFNIMMRLNGFNYEIYFAPRDIRLKTDIYGKGQFGYAEIAGVFCTYDKSIVDGWVKQGAELFRESLKDVSFF